MGFTIFYSWQSDIPNNINRNFIEECLKKAIKKIGTDTIIQNALRDKDIELDKDTKGISGTPPITEVIFEKISNCGIFVPDLTFVGKSDEGRLLPNPNVLIEYGWALKGVTTERIIPIMNTAFGEPSWETLPFNMRHLRFPLQYHLTEDTSSDKRSEIQKKLIDNLTNAIKLILENNLIEDTSISKPFIETKHTNSPSTFIKPDEVFATIYDDQQVVLPNVGRLFLRLIPTGQTVEIKSSKEAVDLVRSGKLLPLTFNKSSWTYDRNSYGGFVLEKYGGDTVNLTQLFKSKEIWGINNYAVNKEYFKKKSEDFGYINPVMFEKIFIECLDNYIKFASNTLHLPLPLRFIVGATDVKGYRMLAPPNMAFDGFDKYGGRIVDNDIVYHGEIIDLNVNSKDILRPFFDYVWEECGLTRPDKDTLVQ